jgi:hypothetical protein
VNGLHAIRTVRPANPQSTERKTAGRGRKLRA